MGDGPGGDDRLVERRERNREARYQRQIELARQGDLEAYAALRAPLMRRRDRQSLIDICTAAPFTVLDHAVYASDTRTLIERWKDYFMLLREPPLQAGEAWVSKTADEPIWRAHNHAHTWRTNPRDDVQEGIAAVAMELCSRRYQEERELTAVYDHMMLQLDYLLIQALLFHPNFQLVGREGLSRPDDPAFHRTLVLLRYPDLLVNYAIRVAADLLASYPAIRVEPLRVRDAHTGGMDWGDSLTVVTWLSRQREGAEERGRVVALVTLAGAPSFAGLLDSYTIP